MVVTTTSITAVSESMRSAQSAFRSAKVMNENIGTRTSWPPKPTSKKAYQDSTQVITKNVEVINSAARQAAAPHGRDSHRRAGRHDRRAAAGPRREGGCAHRSARWRRQ